MQKHIPTHIYFVTGRRTWTQLTPTFIESYQCERESRRAVHQRALRKPLYHFAQCLRQLVGCESILWYAHIMNHGWEDFVRWVWKTPVDLSGFHSLLRSRVVHGWSTHMHFTYPLLKNQTTQCSTERGLFLSTCVVLLRLAIPNRKVDFSPLLFFK